MEMKQKMKLSYTGCLVAHHILIFARPHIKEMKHCERWVVRTAERVTYADQMDLLIHTPQTLKTP